jgi:thymidylate synthase
MPKLFEGTSANEVWQQVATALLNEEQASVQNSRLGNTRELLHTIVTIRDPRRRWVSSRSPGINPAFAIAEVFWILSGSDSAIDINFWNPALPRFAGNSDRYHGAYGNRLRNSFGFDQLDAAYLALLENPLSRQVVLQIWDASTDFPRESGKPAAPDIPCNICSLLKLRNGRLEWVQILRSNDIFRGTPYNVIQFTMIQEIMAGWLGCDVGEYTQYCDSMHLYESDVEIFSIDTDLEHELPVTEFLSLPITESKLVICEMINRLKRMTDPQLTEQSLVEIVSDHSLPLAYKNLLCISAADCARRRGWLVLMDRVADDCNNQTLARAWTKWKSSRFEKKGDNP